MNRMSGFPNGRDLQEAAHEGLCLRYPENLGLHQAVTYETAVNMLLRAIQLSQQVPYSWGFVDKPQEGQALLLFLPGPQASSSTSFPNDGIRFQDQEVRYSIPAGSGRELEVMEVKYGFIPNSTDTSAWRLRRRYRLHKGGHPQLVLVHYTRGPSIQIVPSLMAQPVRSYPLRVVNEPSIFVVGEKAGQKVYPTGPPVPPPPQQHPPNMPGAPFTTQAMLAQQNSAMQDLERRRERERGRDRSGSMGTQRQAPPRVDDDDSGDEADTISTRTLAMTRYARNHELMNEVFTHAAFGDKKKSPPPSPYSIFNKPELEDKMAKLDAEIEVLKKNAAIRKAKREAEEAAAAAAAVADVGLEAADMSTEAIAA